MKNKHFTLVTLSICFLFTLKVGFSKEAKWWFSNTVNASGDWITAPCVFKGGTATYGTDVSGPYLKLDGIDDYFETPAFASPGNNFTVSLFVKSDNAVWNATDALLYKKNGFTLSTHKGTTKISIGLNRNGVLTRYYYDMLVPITDWHHYAVTFDGVKGNVKLFIDGQLAKHVIDVGSIGAEETPLLVGSDGLGKNFFKGGVDDIRIYDFTQLDKIVQTMTRLPDEPTYAWNLAGNLQDSGGNFHLQGLGAIDYVRTYKGIAASLQAGSYLQSLNDFSVSNDTFFISCLMQLNANTEKFPQYTTLMEKIGQLRLEGLGGTKTVRFSVYINR
ncbi:MAG: LamG domain-containing protein [Verrucomicrobiota bacterium]